MDKKESHLEITQKARSKDWSKWQYQMIIQSPMCYMFASLSFNLLSVGQLCDLGFICLFTEKKVVVSKKDDQVIFKDFRYNNLYLVDLTSEDVNLKTCLFTKTSLGWLWHRRLAHVGMSSLKKLIKNELVRGLNDVKV